MHVPPPSLFHTHSPVFCCSDSVSVHNVSQCTFSCPPLLIPPSLRHALLSPAVLLFFSVTLLRSTSSYPSYVCRATYWKMRKLSCLSAAVFFSIHLCPFHLPALIFQCLCPGPSVYFSPTPLIFLCQPSPLSLMSLYWDLNDISPMQRLAKLPRLFRLGCVCVPVGFVGQWLSGYLANLCC